MSVVQVSNYMLSHTKSTSYSNYVLLAILFKYFLFLVGERPPSATCPPGVPIVGCINAPTACAEATCPNFPSATCIFDNCGGCDAKFFVGNRDVTRRCGKAVHSFYSV